MRGVQTSERDIENPKHNKGRRMVEDQEEKERKCTHFQNEAGRQEKKWTGQGREEGQIHTTEEFEAKQWIWKVLTMLLFFHILLH